RQRHDADGRSHPGPARSAGALSTAGSDFRDKNTARRPRAGRLAFSRRVVPILGPHGPEDGRQFSEKILLH
ncbi:MAG: hypothetical protein WBE90_24810, partial [Xanthobacteraceae bacterium]